MQTLFKIRIMAFLLHMIILIILPVNTNTIRLSNSKSSLTSGTYRLKSVFTLTNSIGKTENITIYSSEKRVG